MTKEQKGSQAGRIYQLLTCIKKKNEKLLHHDSAS